jgi:hypothetical protein
MSTIFQNPIPPYPIWKRRFYRLSRPVTGNDIKAFQGNQELVVRETGSDLVHIIHKHSLLEIYGVIGEDELEVFYNPDKESYSLGYLDALLMTRF